MVKAIIEKINNAAVLHEPVTLSRDQAQRLVAEYQRLNMALSAQVQEPQRIDAEGARIADAIELCDWSGCSIGNKEILKAAVAALRTLAQAPQAVAVPDGYVLVPKKPTEDMLDAALSVHEIRDGEDEEFFYEFKRTYRAMLAAAPAAPTGDKP